MAARPTCAYCGAALSAGARYCDRCGTPLQQPGTATPSRRRGRPERRVAVWVFLLVLLLVFSAGTAGGYAFRTGRVSLDKIVPAGAASAISWPVGKHPDLTTENPKATAEYLRSVVAINAKPAGGGDKWGSGFIIDDRGHVVTAAHVVEEGSACVTVVDDNGREHQGIVLQYDGALDLALLHVADLERWSTHLDMETAPDPAAIGDNAYVLGSPRGVGNNIPLSAKVTRLGVEQTALGRTHKNLIQMTDVSVPEGTSGGPLVNKATGKVIGVVLLSGHPTAIAWARPVTDIAAKVREWAALKPSATCQVTPATRMIPLTLVTITPRTGVNSLEGEDLADGAELALRDMAPELQRVGYQVSIKREDDQGSPATARDKAAQAGRDPKVIGVVGSLDNQTTRAAAEALRSSGLPIVAPTADADDLTSYGWGHFNRLVARSGRQEQVLANFAKELLKVGSVYVLEDGSTDAAQQASAFTSAAQIISLRVAGTARVAPTTDPAEIKKKLQESRAESVYYAGAGDTVIRLVKWLRQDGVTLPFLGNQNAFSPAQFQTYKGAGAQGIYFTRLTAEPVDQFRRAFETVWGKPTGGYAAYGYDASRVILEALVRYGETHTARAPGQYELARLVRETRGHRGWTALITFDETGENQTPVVHVYEWRQGAPEYKYRAGSE